VGMTGERGEKREPALWAKKGKIKGKMKIEGREGVWPRWIIHLGMVRTKMRKKTSFPPSGRECEGQKKETEKL